MSLLKYLKSYATSGTIMSSSTAAIRKLMEEVAPDVPQVIVELGGGTGKVTRQILSQMNSNGKLICFEIQPQFLDELRTIDDPRLVVVCDSAVNILDHVNENSVDTIFSTLPLSFFQPEMRTKLLANCYHALKEKGTYRQLSFLFFPRYFSNIFDTVITQIRIIDMPPAVLYFCTKSNTKLLEVI